MRTVINRMGAKAQTMRLKARAAKKGNVGRMMLKPKRSINTIKKMEN